MVGTIYKIILDHDRMILDILLQILNDSPSLSETHKIIDYLSF